MKRPPTRIVRVPLPIPERHCWWAEGPFLAWECPFLRQGTMTRLACRAFWGPNGPTPIQEDDEAVPLRLPECLAAEVKEEPCAASR